MVPEQLKKEIKERSMGYIVAALGVVAGLAWNEAIKGLIDYLFPLSTNSIVAKFIYALLMTLVVVVFTVYLSRLLLKKDQESTKR